MLQNFGIYRTFWYLAFKIMKKKKKIVTIEVCIKNAEFSNIGEITEKYLINSSDWFYFRSHFNAFYCWVLIFYRMKRNAPKGNSNQISSINQIIELINQSINKWIKLKINQLINWLNFLNLFLQIKISPFDHSPSSC